MKKKDTQINFDFIGNQEPLSREDKNLISEYFKTMKERRTILKKKTITSKSKKIFA